jgi:hypothetical protein
VILNREKGGWVFRERLYATMPIFLFVLYLDYVLHLSNFAMGENSKAANKKVVDDVASAVTALTWPTGWYDLFIPALLAYAFAILSTFINMLVLCVVHTPMFTYQYEINTSIVSIMIYLWIKLIKKLLILSTHSSSHDRVLDAHFRNMI